MYFFSEVDQYAFPNMINLLKPKNGSLDALQSFLFLDFLVVFEKNSR